MLMAVYSLGSLARLFRKLRNVGITCFISGGDMRRTYMAPNLLNGFRYNAILGHLSISRRLRHCNNSRRKCEKYSTTTVVIYNFNIGMIYYDNIKIMSDEKVNYFLIIYQLLPMYFFRWFHYEAYWYFIDIFTKYIQNHLMPWHYKYWQPSIISLNYRPV